MTISSRVDARGLSCPMPVVLTKRAIDEGASSIEVLVDSPVAEENVSRLLSSRGFSVEVEAKGGFRILKASRR